MSVSDQGANKETKELQPIKHSSSEGSREIRAASVQQPLIALQRDRRGGEDSLLRGNSRRKSKDYAASELLTINNFSTWRK